MVLTYHRFPLPKLLHWWKHRQHQNKSGNGMKCCHVQYSYWLSPFHRPIFWDLFEMAFIAIFSPKLGNEIIPLYQICKTDSVNLIPSKSSPNFSYSFMAMSSWSSHWMGKLSKCSKLHLSSLIVFMSKRSGLIREFQWWALASSFKNDTLATQSWIQFWINSSVNKVFFFIRISSR